MVRFAAPKVLKKVLKIIVIRHSLPIYVIIIFLCLLKFSPLVIAEPTYANKLSYQVLYSLPHNTHYFTQGLVYEKPFLYESTGLYGQSKLIKYKLHQQQLQTLQVTELDKSIFAEGLALDDDNLVLLSYKKGKAWVYDREKFQLIKEYQYQGEGWGLTSALGKFYMSNGSSKLILRSKKDFTLLHTLPVTFNNKPLAKINELEWVKGYIAANIWYEQRIVLINPFSGKVEAYIDLSRLIKANNIATDNDNVANGIAYNTEKNILYVTGKRWSKIFALSVDFEKS